jgi:polyisoprenoid-binding protein YceI
MGTAHRISYTNRLFKFCRITVFALLLAAGILTSAQQTTLQLDPAKTALKFTLDAALHTVHGTFQLKQSSVQLDTASGQVSGQIVVDAKSGQTGNGMRDRKMNNDVLESSHYPEISFRPSRIDGAIANQGKSMVTVHGMFSIHGMEREIAVPAQVEMDGDHWTATVRFTVPYAKWGMKNPSTLFLRVSDSVEIDLVASGSVVRHTASSTP